MARFFKTLAVILILSFSLDDTISADSCGDWEAYKDEKCLKIFETAGLLSYQDAENFCLQQDDSHLLSIRLEEEQTFIESFLKSHAIADYIWIGLKYINNVYQWPDGGELHYSNWANGSPKNDTDHCVQIVTDDELFGKWSDVLCSKKNLVICEKIQPWSLIKLQTAVMNLMENPTVPIGFMYVQLPDEKSPEEVWSWMEWEDVSASYAGVFLRIVGGNSGEFGEVQEETAPRLNSMKMLVDTTAKDHIDISANNQFSASLAVDGISCVDPCGHWALQAKVSNDEVRPRNIAVRIWKRTK